MTNLQTVRTKAEVGLEIKKSQFIAHLVPINDFKSTMERLRDDHKKARHFVWATRLLNEQQQIVENCSDDGEPRNTSGKPTLKVLQGNDLIDVGIITVRYFGGIKLGTGGLVRAYNDAAQQVVQQATLIPLESLYSKTIRIPYQQMRHVEYQLKLHKIKVIAKDFSSLYVDLTVQADRSVLEKAFEKIETLDPS